jgi:hypothetical protein
VAAGGGCPVRRQELERKNTVKLTASVADAFDEDCSPRSVG